MKKPKCENCGFINKPGEEICANCGKSLIKTDENPTAPKKPAVFRNTKFRRSSNYDLTNN